MKTAADWMKDPQLYTTSALLLLMDRFGVEFMEWDPLTISLELKTNYGFEPSETLQDMIQAGASLFTSNLFFVSLESFAAMANALNFGTVTSELFLPPDVDDCAWACTEAKILLGEDYEGDGFSHNVAAFVGAILDDEGIYDVPSSLSFAEFPDGRDMAGDEAFSGDQIGHQAYTENKAQAKKEIEKILTNKTTALMRQLVSLPLDSGSAAFIQDILDRSATPQG